MSRFSRKYYIFNPDLKRLFCMRIRTIFSFFCLTFFLYALDVENAFAGGQKRTLTQEGQELPEPKRRLSAQDGFRLFRKACESAGIKVRQCIQILAKECIHPDTESIASENIEYDGDIEGSISDFNPASPTIIVYGIENYEDIIKQAHQQVCLLTSGGAVSSAAENIENTLYRLSELSMNMADLNHQALLRFVGLFRIWSQLPHIQKERSDASAKIQRWMTRWPDNNWLDYASDVLVDMLGNVYESGSDDDSEPPGYFDVWLDDVLKNISSSEARDAVKYMVKASVNDGEKQEYFLRDAILTGYSHPLPYLRLINHFVSRKLYEQAHHIFEMYRLVVLFNRYWDNATNADGSEIYWRSQEVYRLQTIYRNSLDGMRREVPTQARNYIPNKDRLDASLEFWPESTRGRAEDMLFAKAFEAPWKRASIISFAEAVIERSLQRWHNDGMLPAMTEKVHAYIKGVYAQRRTLDTLHDKLATMLTRLGREKEAVDLLYQFVDGYKEGLSTDYDVALYLIATAHTLNHRGQYVEIPSYDQALQLGKEVYASGQRDALGERVIKIRNEAQEEQADLASLSQLFNSIPSELRQFNPRGPMDSTFGFNLLRGLQEASNRGLYEGDIPSFSESADFYRKIARGNSGIIQLFTPAFNHGDIEEVTGLYLQGLTELENKTISDESLALQWMSASRRLAEHDQSILPINHLQEALALIPRDPSQKEQMYWSLWSIRRNKWLSHSAESAKSVAKTYKKHMKKTEMRSTKNLKKELNDFLPLPLGLSRYHLHTVRGDGLCMYHALAAMHNVAEQSLIREMLIYLGGIYYQIQENLLNQEKPFSHLTATQIQAITPIVMTAVSGNELHLEELVFQIESLDAALLQALTGENQGVQAWGTDTLLNTAAVVLNEAFNIDSPIFALMDQGGMIIHEFHSDGHHGIHDHIPGNGLPLLVHNGSNHWQFATQHQTEMEKLIRKRIQMHLIDEFMGGSNMTSGLRLQSSYERVNDTHKDWLEDFDITAWLFNPLGSSFSQSEK